MKRVLLKTLDVLYLTTLVSLLTLALYVVAVAL